MRRIALVPVRRWPAAIWAIGGLAEEAYRSLARSWVPVESLSYYSDLSPYFAVDRSRRAPGPIRLLYAGRLEFQKGYDVVLHTVERLARLGTDFHLTVAGDGSLNGMLDGLPDAARDRIRFLGFQQRDALPEVFSQADALLFPSRYDGWGLAVVEAMAAGMPVLGSIHAGACVDLIQDGITGFLVDPFRTDDLFERLRLFLGRPEMLDAMGREARRRAREMDVTVGAARFAELVRKALGMAVAQELPSAGRV
jgi:glycosyltransferase involved in cell wall biosynthesis